MKSYQLFAVMLVLTTSIFAQANKFQTAWAQVEEYKNSEFKNTDALLEALEAINETVKNETQSTKSKVWYYKGLINHLIYENESISSQHPHALFDASEAYQKALTVEVGKKPYEPENTKSNLYNLTGQLQNRGAQLYNMNDFDNAYKCFLEVRSIKKFLDGIAYEKKVDDSDATFNAALCLYKLEKKEEAKKLFQELIDRNYDSPAIYQLYAGLYSDEKNDAEALEILAKGMERYPDNLGLIIDELNIYIRQGREEESITKLEKAAKLDSTNAQIYYALGAAYDKLNNKEKAEQAYLKSVTLDPQNHSAYNNLGAMYYNQGIAINKEMMDNPKLTEKQYNEMQEQRNELYRKSLPYFEKARQIKPDDLAILQALKEVYAKLEMYEKSKEIKEQMEKVKQTKQN
ncbi:MAG TPA: tetratricopeptide repeat protein [Chitinophagales bacterium]|nr:tetratricopeptide repeat protein [Chitinophagales bacterium]